MAHIPKARLALVQRLIEIVSWPETRIPAHERQLAADILVGLLRTSSTELRQRCAEGLIRVSEAPKPLLRYLARDELAVATRLLEEGVGFDDSDLIAVVRTGAAGHWQAIARRRNLGEPITDALFQTGDADAMRTVLLSRTARLSIQGIDLAVSISRSAPSLITPLVARPELKPTQALVLFWWAPFEARLQLLRRFAIDRQVLIKELGEVFKIAADEGWSDPETRKTLQVIERRQRNRTAAMQSPHGSLEGAITIGERGMDRALLNEMAHLGGIKPATARQIFADASGEAIAVFCKAVGLKRQYLIALWRALRRPMGNPEATDNHLGRAMFVFDTLATAKAQTVLRYWNWSFTADAAGLDQALEENLGEMSLARRNATLLHGRIS